MKNGAGSASPIDVSENRNAMKLEVECYSGQKADERPLRFRMDGRQYVVKDILDQWYEPESISYRVRADDGNLYIIRHQTSIPNGTWELVSFRQGRE
jgi:hypothetical protein